MKWLNDWRKKRVITYPEMCDNLVLNWKYRLNKKGIIFEDTGKGFNTDSHITNICELFEKRYGIKLTWRISKNRQKYVITREHI